MRRFVCQRCGRLVPLKEGVELRNSPQIWCRECAKKYLHYGDNSSRPRTQAEKEIIELMHGTLRQFAWRLANEHHNNNQP